ncbi:MAG: AAA family ATPase [Actinomycetota bacterium]
MAPEGTEPAPAPAKDPAQWTDAEWQELDWAIGRAFSPAAPVSNRDLFAGRTDQMRQLIDVAYEIGRHAVLYGERGVGKTSLASIMKLIHEGQEKTDLAVRVNCDGSDSYDTIWRKAFNEISITSEQQEAGFRGESRRSAVPLGKLVPSDKLAPNDIRRVLEPISRSKHTVIFIDEFDRVRGSKVKAMFADTIKMFSDQLLPATIVLVGVADNVGELIAEHHSVERALLQIHMPRMSRDELAEIVERGLASVDMNIQDEGLGRITQLSQGLPHYAHLLGQASARQAVADQRLNVSLFDVEAAIPQVIKDAHQSIVDLHQRAIHSTRETLYPEVLLAAALAKGDDLGFFAAADVRAPLTAIMGKPYDIPAFSRHLNALSEEERGSVLQKRGQQRKFRFRFTNPLLQPYVVMRGLEKGLLRPELLERFS